MVKSPIYASDLYNLPNLKIIINDSIPEILNEEYSDTSDNKLVFRECHLLTDIKIVVGMVSVILSAITTYISLRRDFNHSYYLLFALVGSYFILNFLYETASKMFNWSNIICQGKMVKDDSRLKIQTMSSPTPGQLLFQLTIAGKKTKSLTVPMNIHDLFDKKGLFLRDTVKDKMVRGIERVVQDI